MPDVTSLLATNPATAIPGMALGAIQSVASLINLEKAKREAKELERSRPKREISPLIGENLSLAESELAGGMSQAAEAAYNNQLSKSQSASLSAILRGGGSVNNVADVFAAGEEGRQRLAMLTDQLRLKQIDNVVKARTMSAEETDKNFLFNDWMPWSDKAAANAEARRDATAGIWSGLQTATGGLTTMLGGMNTGGGGGSFSGGNGFEATSGTMIPSFSNSSPATAFGSRVPYNPAISPRNPNSPASMFGSNVPFNPAIQPSPLTPYAAPAYSSPQYNQPFYFGG